MKLYMALSHLSQLRSDKRSLRESDDLASEFVSGISVKKLLSESMRNGSNVKERSSQFTPSERPSRLPTRRAPAATALGTARKNPPQPTSSALPSRSRRVRPKRGEAGGTRSAAEPRNSSCWRQSNENPFFLSFFVLFKMPAYCFTKPKQ